MVKMTDSLSEMYQEVILDHNRKPRNFRVLEKANYHSHGRNPICGDDYHIFLNVNDENIIQDVSFFGKGCAISKASSSMMTFACKGKSVEHAKKLKDRFLQLVTQDKPSLDGPALGGLVVFEGVKKFPVRVKCATLIWRALENALESKDKQDEITTE